MPLYDEVEIEDMKWDEKERCFTYACPCGDLFSISLEDLRNGEEMATCPSCTLFVQVIYNQVRAPVAHGGGSGLFLRAPSNARGRALTHRVLTFTHRTTSWGTTGRTRICSSR